MGPMCDSLVVRAQSDHSLANQMAELARNLAVPLQLDQVLEGVTRSVLEVLPGAEMAGFLLFTKAEKFETQAATADLMYTIDALQVRHGEGPCMEAAIDELIVRTDDFEHEQRWPHFTADVLDLGLRSALSFKLYTSQRNAGALNIFSTQPNAFGPEDEALGQVLAVISGVRTAGSSAPVPAAPQTLSTTLEFDVGAGSIVSRRWPRHPRCPC